LKRWIVSSGRVTFRAYRVESRHAGCFIYSVSLAFNPGGTTGFYYEKFQPALSSLLGVGFLFGSVFLSADNRKGCPYAVRLS
jgi:hypothetical protein